MNYPLSQKTLLTELFDLFKKHKLSTDEILFILSACLSSTLEFDSGHEIDQEDFVRYITRYIKNTQILTELPKEGMFKC